MNVKATESDLNQEKNRLIDVLKDLIRNKIINLHELHFTLNFRNKKLGIKLNKSDQLIIYCFIHSGSHVAFDFEKYFLNQIKTEEDIIELQKMIIGLL